MICWLDLSERSVKTNICAVMQSLPRDLENVVFYERDGFLKVPRQARHDSLRLAEIQNIRADQANRTYGCFAISSKA